MHDSVLHLASESSSLPYIQPYRHLKVVFMPDDSTSSTPVFHSVVPGMVPPVTILGDEVLMCAKDSQ